jgi:delta 1-pyrroline-5-carboxylate dehydrogenase
VPKRAPANENSAGTAFVGKLDDTHTSLEMFVANKIKIVVHAMKRAVHDRIAVQATKDEQDIDMPIPIT